MFNIDLNNLSETERLNHIIKCQSQRIDFLEDRVKHLEENQIKILSLLSDNTNSSINIIEKRLNNK